MIVRYPLIAVIGGMLSMPGQTALAADEGKGPYEAVAGSPNIVWVIDTRTGQVRKCTQEFADQAPKCTPMSN